MNSIERLIYDEGENINTDFCFTIEGDEIRDEYILIDNLVYCFTFYNGNFVWCRLDKTKGG